MDQRNSGIDHGGKLTGKDYQVIGFYFLVLLALAFSGFALFRVTEITISSFLCRISAASASERASTAPFTDCPDLSFGYILVRIHNLSTTFKNALTTSGSNCVPVFFLISSTASSLERGCFL